MGIIKSRDLEQYRQFFEIQGGSKVAEIVKSNLPFHDSVTKINDLWQVTLHCGDPTWVVLHEAAHQRYSSFDELAANQAFSDTLILRLVNVIEDARIEYLAEEWFNKPLFDLHRHMLLEQVPDVTQTNIIQCIASFIYDLSMVMTPLYQNVINKFGGEIREAIKSTTSDNAVGVAIKIAAYLAWEQNKNDSTQNKTVISDEIFPSLDDVKLEDIDILINNTVTDKLKKYNNILNNRNKEEKIKGTTNDLLYHSVEIVYVTQTPIILHKRVRFLLNDCVDYTEFRSSAQYGVINPTKIWRTAIGDINIFSKHPSHVGKIVILVDLSTSMECRCNVSDPLVYPIASGMIARQVVGLLTQRFSNAAVFGFCSSSDTNFIVPITPRFFPLCSIHGDLSFTTLIPGGGNLDCSALLWLEQYFWGIDNDVQVIIVSDGNPAGPFPAECDSFKHTRMIAQRLYKKGVRYASVLINNQEQLLYPSDIVVHVDDIEQISLLQHVFSFLLK